MSGATSPFPLGNPHDFQELLNRLQQQLDEFYQERVGGAFIGDVFEVGEDETLTLVLSSTGGLTKVNNQLSVKVDPVGGVTLGTGGVLLKLKTNGGLSMDVNGVTVTVKVNGGILLDSNGLSVKVKADSGILLDADGVSVLLKADNGLAMDANGLYVKRKASYGIDVDADGLKLKKQATMSDASAVSSISLGVGADTVDRNTFNTDLATLVSEINGIKDSVNTLLGKLQAAEIIA